MGGARAAVDVGTNSCRLLVLGADGTPLARELEITRLGAGVDERGRLDDDALERTLDTLRRFRGIWTTHGADGQVRVAATSAVRDAADRDRFLEGVRRAVEVEPEVLTAESEARLAYRGAVSAIDAPTDGVVVLDVGGGSTELVAGGAEPEAWVSMQLGSVRLTERCLTGDPPAAPEVAAARIEIADRLSEAATSLRVDGFEPQNVETLVGVAGTVTTLGMLAVRRPRYEEGAVHGREVALPTVREWSDRLLTMPAAEVAGLGPVQAGREDVLAAGVLIVRGVMERLGFDRLVVSEADSLDALLMDGP